MLSEKEVARHLVEIDAIRLNPDNPFKWASGRYSPIYCDNRKILSYPEFRKEVILSLCEKSSQLGSYNKIAGVATAGIAHGALMAAEQHQPFIYIRSSAKKHGAKNQIEGHWTSQDVCLVVEDLISTGGSSLKAVDVLKENGIGVAGTIAIFTYGFDESARNFEQAGVPLVTLSNYRALLEVMEESGKLTSHQLRSLGQWREDPVRWSQKHEQKLINQ